MALIVEFEEIVNHEETTWRQRYRVVSLKKGDNNTIFFHKITNAHRRTNTIDKLKVNEVLVIEPNEIQREIINYYEKLYLEIEER